jgi:hypothetical protein
MSALAPAAQSALDADALRAALELVAGSAGAVEAAGEPAPFPEAAVAGLERAGAFAWGARPGPRPPAREELELVRAVARADGSVGRILDGHLNAIERLCVQAPAELRERELAAVRAGALRAGVWGADPRAGEGSPAAVVRSPGTPGGEALRGTKTFCSGAGGLQRALVLARAPEGGPPLAVWVDVRPGDAVEIDTRWYRGHGLRASASHRVHFRDAPVLARFGGPGALAAEPWFHRDALRTAASWVGMLDCAVDAALSELRARERSGALESLAAGRILAAARACELWLAEAARAMDSGVGLAAASIYARAAIFDAAERVLGEAARACGSHPFATGGALERARRDLEVFLLQHRLDPLLARWGERELARGDRWPRLDEGSRTVADAAGLAPGERGWV